MHREPLKVQAVACVVRLVAENTNLIRRPSEFETLFGGLFAPVESYDIRIAKNVVAKTDRAVEALKQRRTNKKFKSIIQDF